MSSNKIGEADARKLYRLIKRGDQATIDGFVAKNPFFANTTSKDLAKKLVNGLTEDQFVGWAATGFDAKDMPAIKIKAEELQFLSGGYAIDIGIGGHPDHGGRDRDNIA